MDTTTSNFVESMPGPQFLAFYAVLIAGTIFICRTLIRKFQPGGSTPLPEVPASPDPYEVAYLRGGEIEALRVVLFSLIHRGYLQFVKYEYMDDTIGELLHPGYRKAMEEAEAAGLPPGYRTAKPLSEVDSLDMVSHAVHHPGLDDLTPLERAVFDRMAKPVSQFQIFSPDLLKRAKLLTADYQQRLIGERLLVSPFQRLFTHCLGIAVAFMLLYVGFHKWSVAISHGHQNVSILCYMWLAAPILAIIYSWPPRIFPRGQMYLDRLRMTFDQKQTQVKTPSTATPTKAAEPPDGSEMALLLGVFGATALSGTFYDKIYSAIGASVWSGGSSGGSGSTYISSGGGGGGGGGCGGCGGSS